MSDEQRDLHHQGGDDDEGAQHLRAQLTAIDPATALPAADPVGVARLMEDAMSQNPESPRALESPDTIETRTDHLRDRSRLTWIVAAAATAVIVGGVGFAVASGGRDDPVVAADAPGDAGTASADGSGEVPSVSELSLAEGAPATKCLTPEAAPQVVAAQTLVVDATVESISGGVVTLAPTTFYAGEETDLVTVSQPDGDLQVLLSGVEFEEGGRYLVSATDGQVTLCGFSAPYSDQLAAVYDEAFPG